MSRKVEVTAVSNLDTMLRHVAAEIAAMLDHAETLPARVSASAAQLVELSCWPASPAERELLRRLADAVADHRGLPAQGNARRTFRSRFVLWASVGQFLPAEVWKTRPGLSTAAVWSAVAIAARDALDQEVRQRGGQPVPRAEAAQIAAAAAEAAVQRLLMPRAPRPELAALLDALRAARKRAERVAHSAVSASVRVAAEAVAQRLAEALARLERAEAEGEASEAPKASKAKAPKAKAKAPKAPEARSA